MMAMSVNDATFVRPQMDAAERVDALDPMSLVWAPFAPSLPRSAPDQGRGSSRDRCLPYRSGLAQDAQQE